MAAHEDKTALAIDTSDFRNGMHFYMDGDVWTIVEFQHVKPGKGGAFVRTKLRKVRTGQQVEKTFRSGERVEPAFVEKVEMQYLYKQQKTAVLMDLDTYEQVEVPMASLGEQASSSRTSPRSWPSSRRTRRSATSCRPSSSWRSRRPTPA